MQISAVAYGREGVTRFKEAKGRSLRLLELAEKEEEPAVRAYLASKALQTYLSALIRRVLKERAAGTSIRSLWYELSIALMVDGFRGYMGTFEDLLVKHYDDFALMERVLSEGLLEGVKEEEAERILKVVKKIMRRLREIEEEVWPS